MVDKSYYNAHTELIISFNKLNLLIFEDIQMHLGLNASRSVDVLV